MAAVANNNTVSPPLGIDGIPQANIIPSAHSKATKSRHRASVACAACRDRRTRCVVPAGESECNQCKSAGYECVINYDDERRKPNSKAYMQSLTDRIAVLENMLKEKGEEPPPAQEVRNNSEDGNLPMDSKPNETTSAVLNFNGDTLPKDAGVVHESSPDLHEHSSPASDGHTPPSTLSTGSKESMVKRLLSTRGHLSFDQLSGRLRYFGPSTNMHVYSELNPSHEANRQRLEQQRRAERIIRTLPPDTYDYLMDLFWQHYNPIIHVVHQAAFDEDRENGRNQFYSGFLHVCVLAMGFRYADKSRADMMRLGAPSKECTLHREAKYMLDSELERPGGIPTIAALLLLGDLECGVGRDNVGWLYAGMANRLCFDVGLHLDNRYSGLQQREIEIGRMTLWACVVYDKYWALFLGRPTMIKPADLEIYSLSQQFERLGACQPAGPGKSIETKIYETLLDLMELAGKITEITDPAAKTNSNFDHQAYLRMAALDRELGAWYARLPPALQWTPENMEKAPFSFFLLHQQYHATMILLHRPFALYDDAKPNPDSDVDGPDSHLSALSRTVCTKHAIRVARIFWQHRQRFDTRFIFVTGMQHAGTAATALIAALAYIKDRASRIANLQYLECLAAALQDMAYTFQPAERMSAVVQAVMMELRDDGVGSLKPRSSIPARRGSSNDPEMPQLFGSYKKRHIVRPNPVRTKSTILENEQELEAHHEHSASFSGAPNASIMARTVGNKETSNSTFGDFVVITPHLDTSSLNGVWPSLSSADATSLDHPMSSYNDRFNLSSSMHLLSNGPNGFNSTWMGAETPNISRPPTAPDLSRFRHPSLPQSINEQMEDNPFSGDMNNMEFVPMLNSADWLASNEADTADSEPRQQPSIPTTSSGISSQKQGTPKTSSSDRNLKAQAMSDAGFSNTIGGLNEMWNEMFRASRA